MSRRDSRSSTTTRQNDALFEFENFKKRFLVVNKQITKLNSSMSVRIEELNAQISCLYTENLRLRASEIALETQLKREREKSKKTLAEMETALTRQLAHLRRTLDIPAGPNESPEPFIPRAQQRPVVEPNSKLSRQPTVPDIIEHDDEVEDPPKRHKTKRLSASKLPLPSRAISPSPTPAPPIPIQMEVGMGSKSKRKSSRRQSGLLDVEDRPPSPAFGSPISKGLALEEEDEGVAVEDDVADIIDDYRPVMSRKEGKRLKDVTNRGSPPREFLTHRTPSPPQLPTPRHSSSPTPPPFDPDPDPVDVAEQTGRERRTRKSVNYAEPKLNTKMRQPEGYVSTIKKKSSHPPSRAVEPDDDIVLTKKRPSSSNVVYRSDVETDDDGVRSSTDHPTASSSHTSLPYSSSSSSDTNPTKRKRSTTKVYDHEPDDADDADGEYAPTRWVNEGRRRSQLKSGDRRHSAAV